MVENQQLLIEFEDNGKSYTFSYNDFQRVEEYCENECLGIQFLISANILRNLVNKLIELGESPPFTLEDLSSDVVKDLIVERNEMNSIEQNFGSTDLSKISRIVAKQTYNFIHKI
jgi:hypothetical protein